MVSVTTPLGKKLYAQADGRDIVYRRQPDLKKCAACEKEYPEDKLTKIESGQFLCPECIINLKR